MRAALYDRQAYCEKMGYTIRARWEKGVGKLRLIRYKNGQLETEYEELVSYANVPKVYAQRYEELYDFLTKK